MMQHPKVGQYLEALPAEQCALGMRLRELFFDLVPGIEERFSFNLPFYHYFGMFCYLHASADGMMLNFCRGKDLHLVFPELQAGSRKMVAGLPLKCLADANSQTLVALILGAADWQKEAWQLKRGFVEKTSKPRTGKRKK